MSNRSNIDIAGNTVQVQNLGTGEGEIFKDKVLGNTLRFRTLKEGANVKIIENGDEITISGYEPYAALTSSATVTWDASTGLNKTLTRGGNFTLTITNLQNGMSGDLRLNITSTTSITSLTTGGTNRGNGSISDLGTGIYHFAWIYDGSNFDWNIAKYI